VQVQHIYRENKLYAKLSKYDFFQRKVYYLGHVISKKGVAINPDKIKTIIDWPTPRDVTDIISFMGLARYYRRFIKGFSKIVHSITSLQRKGVKFI
jgi:hypothetical protein